MSRAMSSKSGLSFPSKRTNGYAFPESLDQSGGAGQIDRFQKLLFGATSRLTRYFPRAGARLLDMIFRPIVGSSLLSAFFTRHNRRVIRRVKSFRRFLVIPDIHIGDAVMSQAALTALRDFFPEARIDYVVNRTAFPLIEGNPEATRVIPFFSGGMFPTSPNLEALRAMIAGRHYDLVLNFCPYIKDKDISPGEPGVLDFLTNAPTIVRNESLTSPVNHFSSLSYEFVRDLLSLVAEPVRDESFQGVTVTLDDAAVVQARQFAIQSGLSLEDHVILFNPDAASVFTLVPFEAQSRLLRSLAGLRAMIFLGEGITQAGIGQRLKRSLSPRLQARVKIVPADLPLQAFAAFIDLCDVFISADTGPLHIAAARRRSLTGRFQFRNRTAVLGMFGATPARMSGYDSHQPGYLPANQDAPSWAYAAGSPCRNITCLNKLYKTCRSIRCFEEVDVEGLTGQVRSFLRSLSHRSTPLHELKVA